MEQQSRHSSSSSSGRGRGGSGGTGSRLDMEDMAACAAALAVLVFWWSASGSAQVHKWAARQGTARLVPLAAAATVGVIAVLILVVVAVHQTRMRRRMLARLVAVAEGVIGRSALSTLVDGHQLIKVLRWRRGRPSRVKVEYPPQWSPDFAARSELRAALSDKSGVEFDDGKWDTSRDRVTFARSKMGDEKRHEAVALERLESAVAAIVGTHRDGRPLVEVTRWCDGNPVGLRLRYPPTWHADERGREDLRVKLRDKTGVDLDGGTWFPHRDLVTFAEKAAEPNIPEPERIRNDQRERALVLLREAMPTVKTVEVAEWDDTGLSPQVIDVTYGATLRASSDRVRLAIDSMLSAQLAGRWYAKWYGERDWVRFIRRPGLPDRVLLPAAKSAVKAGQVVIEYGVTETGEVVSWDWSGIDPHLLICGATGGGKTVLIRVVIAQAARQGAESVLIDPKRIELKGFRGYPGVSTVATSVDDIRRAIIWVHAEMERRYSQVEADQIAVEDLRPLLLVLDEFFVLEAKIKRAWREAGNKGVDPVLDLIDDLAAMGRSARVHLVIGIQRPDAKFLDGAMRDNLQHRVSLGSLSAQGAQMMWGNYETGSNLPRVRGRATAFADSGPCETQIFFVPDPDPKRAHKLSGEESRLLEAIRPDLKNFGDAAWPYQDRPEFAAPDDSEDDDKPTSNGKIVFSADDDDVCHWVSADQLVAGDQFWLDVNGQERLVRVNAADYDPADEDYFQIDYSDDAARSAVVSLSTEAFVRRLIDLGEKKGPRLRVV